MADQASIDLEGGSKGRRARGQLDRSLSDSFDGLLVHADDFIGDSGRESCVKHIAFARISKSAGSAPWRTLILGPHSERQASVVARPPQLTAYDPLLDRHIRGHMDHL